MKRFWLVLLSLGLIVAFSTSAMAVDLKFSGEYYAAGMYLDKTRLSSDTYTAPTPANPLGSWTKDQGNSTAFYFQRLRLNTVFVVAPGLMLTTRADIMERSWGASRSVTNTTLSGNPQLQGYAANVSSAGTSFENENIAFDLAYVTYISPIGIITAGYQIDNAWGTVFGDNSIPTGKVSFIHQRGPFTFIAQTGKNSCFFSSGMQICGAEQGYPRGASVLGGNNNNLSDADGSFYTAAVRYAWNTGQAGFLYKFVRTAVASGVAAVGEPTVELHISIPYVKAQFGPVAVQSEIMYVVGNYDYDVPGYVGQYDHVSVLNGWIDATADFDRFYFGGTFAYLSGQDPNTDRQTQGLIDGGFDWNPTLILFNADRTQWAGSLNGHNNSTADTAMKNAYFYQLRGGFRPIDKIDIMASVSYAHAVVKPTNAWIDGSYGWEADLTGTYKITNNLSYMLGFGYLFTGDYFKGEMDQNDVHNDFLVINKLTLTF